LPDEAARVLSALVARRRQVQQLLTAEQNRLMAAVVQNAPQALRTPIAEHIEWLRRQIRHLDQDLEDQVRASPVWREREDLLRGIPGVGPMLTTALLSQLPELGRLDRKAIAKLVGVAPPQSGQWPVPGPAHHLGRSRQRARGAVHGGAGRDPPQPSDPRLLPTLAGYG
jgi:transposase